MFARLRRWLRPGAVASFGLLACQHGPIWQHEILFHLHP
jgi:hypothetical protein